MYERSAEQVETALANVPECRAARLTATQIRHIDGYLAAKDYLNDKIAEILGICMTWANSQKVCQKSADIDVSEVLETIKEIAETNTQAMKLKNECTNLLRKAMGGGNGDDTMEHIWKVIDRVNLQITRAEEKLSRMGKGITPLDGFDQKLGAVSQRLDHVEGVLRQRFAPVSKQKTEKAPVIESRRPVLSEYEKSGMYERPQTDQFYYYR